MKDVQTFITVALATAAGGEGDLTHDKLSHLRTVSNGFASLIYLDKESTGYKELAEGCKTLWNALRKNSSLPDLLSTCNGDLEWYKSLKDTQGSVEVTSYNQMTTILKYGTYRVAFGNDVQTVHDLISVVLPKQVPNLLKSRYSLNELQDLESKLVLVCGGEDENRAEVDYYLNLLHSATRIAKLYLDFQKAGDVTYSSAYLQFRCAVYDVQVEGIKDLQFNKDKAKQRVADLQQYIQKLSDRLLSWYKSIDAAREKYYELNCFTTLQLLKLRQDFGHLRELQTVSYSVMSNVLMLLKSFSPNLSPSIVSSSLQCLNQETIDELQPLDRQESTSITVSTVSETTHSLASSAPSPPAEDALTVDKLDKRQKAILTNCLRCGHSESHVLKAFQACGIEADRYTIEEWCEDNEEQCLSETEDIDNMSVEPDIEITGCFDESSSDYIGSSTPTSQNESFFEAEDAQSAIYTEVKKSINKSHPVVQELMNAGYGLTDSLRAASKYGDTYSAMEYLDGGSSAGDENEIMEEDGDDMILEQLITDVNHLSLDQLGEVLQAINKAVQGDESTPRAFDTDVLKVGLPNLLVTSSDNVLQCVLTLYAPDVKQPLPTPEEVLLCTNATTTEEVCLLWRRAVNDPGFKRIFCLAHAEKLSYEVCDSSLNFLKEISQGKKDYRLVIICTKEAEKNSAPIFTELLVHKRPGISPLEKVQLKEYLMAHFTSPVRPLSPTHFKSIQCASTVDPDKSSVRVVTSFRSGVGKSLYIKRRAQNLIHLTSNEFNYVIIPVHGPSVTSNVILNFFNKYRNKSPCAIYHLDISSKVLEDVDCLLFSLLILGGLSDSRGNVWRCHPNQYYVVEVTFPSQDSENQGCQTLNLLELLPTIRCATPREVGQQRVLGEGVIGIDEEELFSSKFQRVYQYLEGYEKGINLDKYFYNSAVVQKNAQKCLSPILSKCGVSNPSWAEVHHFTCFLDYQLYSCEVSDFCKEKAVGKDLPGLKGFVVKFMIRMSQDFTTPSLSGVFSSNSKDDNLEKYQIVQQKQWEQSFHPYIFFNKDGASVTFVGFKVNSNMDLTDPKRPNTVIEKSIMPPNLYYGLQSNNVKLNDNYNNWSKRTMIQKLATVMGFEYTEGIDPDNTYELTTDNLVKMLAILMRFRCDIPVVLMGETGCGKTRLIRYMCDLACQLQGQNCKNLHILKIHGGITDDIIVKFVEEAEKAATRNKAVDPRIDTVAFFDEANTTESIGLIKEIMCDKRMNGKALSGDLKFIAACNPYRKHSTEMIEKLETAGLGFFNQDTQQKLGNVPLRQLVYRVLDIPPSMRPLVYDFGQLSVEAEQRYIYKIVENHINKRLALRDESSNSALTQAIASVLNASQAYMRRQKNECSYVSLRDVERAMIVFIYFWDKMKSVFATPMNCKKKAYSEKADSGKSAGLIEVVDSFGEETKHDDLNDITRSLVLALSVCYHARLQDRETYEEMISSHFESPLKLPGKDSQFRNEIEWCQEVMLESMKLGPNIAKNAALRENVFMMAICIELRIPLFLVGKPGTSKSLAKCIVMDSMLGQGSQSDFLKHFKQVHMFSYQCSRLSTAKSIIEVFKSAQRFQSNQDTKQYVSVVVLDEVGLAEDSPSLPLKALHPLLEDGTEGLGRDHQYEIHRDKRVAFIGISNWALDPAKMNRAVMVTRGEPELNELLFSASGICSAHSETDDDKIKKQLESYFAPLSQAYMKICEMQERPFFGLRDFYSLIKMLYWKCHKCKGLPLSDTQLEHAIKRNFSGLESERFNPFEVFQQEVQSMSHKHKKRELPDTNDEPDCSSQDLIKASLCTKDDTWHGEHRYLLFLTENYAALNILKHFLNFATDNKRNLASQPFILFGSSFPNDNNYSQVCRNINQIKICMETGRTVVLLNLGDQYASLYEVLNQHYIYFGGHRYVDLGLQTNRVKCRVHKDFKLILIAEKSTVYSTFPTPLINRLEKHFVLASTILEKWQLEVLKDFEQWIKNFSQLSDAQDKFKEDHAFVGYQKDTPAAVVIQATHLIRNMIEGDLTREVTWLQEAGILASDFLQKFAISEKEMPEAVLKLSQFLILQTAADDAMVRLPGTTLPEKEANRLFDLYYKHQFHCSLSEYLKFQCTVDQEAFMQVTTHSPLLSQNELIAIVKGSLSIEFRCVDLQKFDTAIDFTNKVRPYFNRNGHGSEQKPFLVIIQCDSGHINYNLITCARYCIYDEAIKAKGIRGITHVLFIVRLPQQEIRSQFVGFLGDPWSCIHIDELRTITKFSILPEQALKTNISTLFRGKCLGAPINSRNFSEMYEVAASVPITKTTTCEEVNHSSKPNGEVCRNEKLPSQSFLSKNSYAVNTSSSNAFSTSLPDVIFNKADYPLHAQHRRLCSCVQAAVSMLRDLKEDRSKKRIEKLLRLNPEIILLDEASFSSILVSFVSAAIEQNEKERGDLEEKNWVFLEATNMRKLLGGGTFRNVLSRRVNEVITPCFAQVIAYIDQNCNMDLLDTTNLNCSTAKFWLSMFKLSESMVDFPSAAASKITVTTDFCCNFPFSWLIKKIVESKIELYQSSLKVEEGLTTILHCKDKLVTTVLGAILDQVPQDEACMFYEMYLHDFVRYSHQSSHKAELQEIEYKLIANALNDMSNNPVLCVEDKCLVHQIVALHVVYSQCCSEIYEFGRLVQHRPGILYSLMNKILEKDYTICWGFNLHLSAIEEVLESNQENDPLDETVVGFNLPVQNDKEQDELTRDIRYWLNHVHMSQNIITPILQLLAGSENEVVVRARKRWQKVQASKIFVENVYLPHSRVKGMEYVIRRFDINLERHSNLLNKKALDKIKFFLHGIPKIKTNILQARDATTRQQLLEHCNDFFVEMISCICFDETPEHDVLQYLFDMVLGNTQPCPTLVIRAFLFFVLLKHTPNFVEECLNNYFGQDHEVNLLDQQLIFLSIQYFIEAKNVHALSSDYQSNAAIGILNKYSELICQEAVPKITFKYLQNVAEIKLIFSFMAEHLINNEIDDHFGEAVKRLCVHPNFTSFDKSQKIFLSSPVLYLIKVMGRRFGFSCLNRISTVCPWIIPKELSGSSLKDVLCIDPFIIYGEQYRGVREAVVTAISTKSCEELAACEQGMYKQCFLACAIYQKVTLTHLSKAKEVQNEVLLLLRESIENCELSQGLMYMMKLLLSNQQGGPLAQMTVSPNQSPLSKILGSVVIHFTAIILSLSSSNFELLLPFINILNNPATLKNAHLPSMPDKVRCLKWTYYESNLHGYPHFDGPNGSEGTVYRDRTPMLHYHDSSNRMTESIKTGYILGDPTCRSSNQETMRGLSTAAVCIIRVLMHSAFVWATCTFVDGRTDQLAHVAQLVRYRVPPEHLPEFFWMHLEKDIECLMKCTKKEIDECAVLLHLVLKQVMLSLQRKSPQYISDSVQNLNTSKDREEWEQLFSKAYIDPILSVLDGSIAKALDTIISDDQQCVHVGRKLEAHIWDFQPQINLEHLKINISEYNSAQVLNTFLEIEPSLRATQYLPDIAKLQRFLYTMYDKYFTKHEAKMRISEFLKRVEKKLNKKSRNECLTMIESLNKAWSLVKFMLRNHKQLAIEEKYLTSEFTPDTSLLYLIPTATREGICTTVLVDYLVQTHNQFIEKCQDVLSRGTRSSTLAVWREYKIPLSQVRRCHMLEYEPHIQSILVSHSHCSFAGHWEIKYDIPALERHILNQFIFGKPTIQLNIPTISFRENVYTMHTLLEIRRKVKPQVDLDSAVQQDIVTELKTPEKLRESLDVVDIVIGLLCSKNRGTNANIMLKKYIDFHRMTKKSFSAKAKEHCTLGHILSLWKTLSFEMARKLWLKKEEPFVPPAGYTRTLEQSQKRQLDGCLRMFDLDLLLGALFEFIEIHVKQIFSIDETCHCLVRALNDYWHTTEQAPIPNDAEQFGKVFPHTITVDQAVATWKYIADYTE